MKSIILTVNAGSSSLKCALFDGETVLQRLSSLPDTPPDAIGHRIVHGGALYTKSVQIDDELLNKLQTASELAPLHNGPAIEQIERCRKKYGPTIAQFAVFDTAFYSQMPKVSSLYAIPRALSERFAIRRYGFHGISHAYLWKAYLAKTGNRDGKIITLHLGAGCSATAIDGGRPMDNSMGFTPNEGLVMATRSGNIDPQVVETLSEKLNRPTREIIELLNRESGLLGLSGISEDMKELLQHYKSNKDAQFAIDLFCHRVVHYIGAYTALLGKVDAIIFSGGIGENSPEIRSLITDRLYQPPPLYVINTDENLEIAREVMAFLR